MLLILLKGIGYGIANPEIEDVWDLYIGKVKTKKCAPIGVVFNTQQLEVK